MKNGKIAAGILSVILLACCCFKIFSFATVSEDERIHMEITYGYNGYVKGKSSVPINFSLENKEEEEFHGTIQVLTKQNGDENYLCEHTFSLGAKEETEFTMVVLLDRQFYVKLLDQSGKVIQEELFKVKSSFEAGQFFIGILTDNYEGIAYFNNYRLNSGGMITKAFSFEAEDIPETALEMDLLDLIIINDFDTSILSERQINAIVDWVRNGGTLLIGTGNSAGKTLSGFDSRFLDLAYSKEESITTDLGVAYKTGEEDKDFIGITYIEMSVKDGEVLFEESGKPLVVKKEEERGVIGVTGFDLAELLEYSKNNPTYVETLLTELITKKQLSKIEEQSLFGDYNKYWAVNAMVQAGHTEKLPNPNIYMVVLIFYIILIGPGLYLLLKKSDRRQYYWRIVTAIAIGCSFLIFILGHETRFQEPFFNYAAIREVEADHMNETVYVNVRAPFNKKYTVNIDPSYSVIPISKDSYYYNYNEDMNGEDAYQVALNQTEEAFRITIQDVVAFTPELFQLNRKSSFDEEKDFQFDIHYFDGKISGTIGNHLGYDLEKAAVIMYGQVIVLGSIKDGETIDIKDSDIIIYPLNYTYGVAKKITGNDLFKEAEVSNEDYCLSYQRSNLLQYYIENYFKNYTAGARMIAFIAEQKETDFVLNNEYAAYGNTMVSFPVKVDYHHENLVYYPILPEEPQIISGDYLAESNTIYGLEPVILEYRLGNDLEIQKVSFQLLDTEIAYSYYIPFPGVVYFLNQETGEYDKKNIISNSFEGEELAPYLSDNNRLTIKYEQVADPEYQWDISLPVLSVVGREKDAGN